MSQKERGALKTARIPVKVVPQPIARKPAWIRVTTPTHPRFLEIKSLLRSHALHTVCEEAACPNIGECFSQGTATFMILGDLCTRRCPFCDVAHGRPAPPDPLEPERLATAIARLGLDFVVITSVDRDDLRDGGASHFAQCIGHIRKGSPNTRIEVLVPDFRRRLESALTALDCALPDILNHNLETVPRLYREVRPGADYGHSLTLLSAFGSRHPAIPTKSGLMLGLGETDEEIETVLKDLRDHGVTRLTLGQYLQPSRGHRPVARFVSPAEFDRWQAHAESMGFKAHCGPLVRSSYHAATQAG